MCANITYYITPRGGVNTRAVNPVRSNYDKSDPTHAIYHAPSVCDIFSSQYLPSSFMRPSVSPSEFLATHR